MTVPGPSNTETLPNWLGNCLEILATPESGYFESAVDVVVEVLRKYESEVRTQQHRKTHTHTHTH